MDSDEAGAEDNLFVLTQCIEVSMVQKQPLRIPFLDIKGAYDSVDRELLWSLLEREGSGKDFVHLLQEIYSESEVQITWEGLKCTKPVVTNRGLKQGCPLSPSLFMLYMANLERKLEDSNIAFNSCYSRKGKPSGAGDAGLWDQLTLESRVGPWTREHAGRDVGTNGALGASVRWNVKLEHAGDHAVSS